MLTRFPRDFKPRYLKSGELLKNAMGNVYLLFFAKQDFFVEALHTLFSNHEKKLSNKVKAHTAAGAKNHFSVLIKPRSLVFCVVYPALTNFFDEAKALQGTASICLPGINDAFNLCNEVLY